MSDKPRDLDGRFRDELLELIRAYGQVDEHGRSFLTEKVYREIEDFRVTFFTNESQHRGRPHCTVTIAGKKANFDIETGEWMVGDISPWKHTVSKVLKEHRDGLLAFWHQTRSDDQKL